MQTSPTPLLGAPFPSPHIWSSDIFTIQRLAWSPPHTHTNTLTEIKRVADLISSVIKWGLISHFPSERSLILWAVPCHYSNIMSHTAQNTTPNAHSIDDNGKVLRHIRTERKQPLMCWKAWMPNPMKASIPWEALLRSDIITVCYLTLIKEMSKSYPSLKFDKGLKLKELF